MNTRTSIYGYLAGLAFAGWRRLLAGLRLAFDAGRPSAVTAIGVATEVFGKP